MNRVRSCTRARGFSLIEVMIVVAIMTIIATIAVARLARASGAAKEGSTVGSLRSISSAQQTAKGTYGRFCLLPELVERGLLDLRFGAAPVEANGYRITEAGAGDAIVYHADPLGVENGIRRYYMRAAEGVIYFTDNGNVPDATSHVLGGDVD